MKTPRGRFLYVSLARGLFDLVNLHWDRFPRSGSAFAERFV